MRSVAVTVASAAALLVGCAPQTTDSAATSELTVFAAASLTAPFTELGERFEAAHPGTTVTFNFAGSATLVAQLDQGAPADVFASADTTNMTRAVDAGVVDGDPVDFATNTLTIVTPPANPKNITTFADLTKPGTQVVVCAPQVPCGAAADKVQRATGVTLAPVSEESAVTDVLGKVLSGQADAGLVYVTDAAGAGTSVNTVAIPEAAVAVNTYPIATVKHAANPQAAQQFIDMVTGADGQEVLAAAGFTTP